MKQIKIWFVSYVPLVPAVPNSRISNNLQLFASQVTIN